MAVCSNTRRHPAHEFGYAGEDDRHCDGVPMPDAGANGWDAGPGVAQPHGEAGERLTAAARGRAAEIAATVEEITRWWTDTAVRDAATTAPKAAEYGAADLAIMGKAMESLFPGLDRSDPAEAEKIGLEMAVAFYTLGKVARLFGAYQQGRLPGDDSWFDLTVYPLMARRIRETGRWV